MDEITWKLLAGKTSNEFRGGFFFSFFKEKTDRNDKMIELKKEMFFFLTILTQVQLIYSTAMFRQRWKQINVSSLLTCYQRR